MMRRSVAAFVFGVLLSATPALAQSAAVQSQLESLGLTPFTYEQLSVTATATVLTSAKVNDDSTLMVAITPLDGDLIFTRNGQTPTSTYGLRLFKYGVVILSKAEAILFKCIRASTSNVTTNVEYYAPVGTTGIP